MLSEPRNVMNTSNVLVRGNMMRNAGTTVIKASDWIWTGNTHAQGTIEIAAGAANNIIRDNVIASPITDKGKDTVLTGNVVRKPTSKP